MSKQIEVVVNGKDAHTVDASRITMFFHDGMQSLAAKGYTTVTAEDTLAMAADGNATVPDFWQKILASKQRMADMLLVFSQEDIDRVKDMKFEDLPVAIRHIIGLLAYFHISMQTGAKFMYKLPETHLHPRHQLGLADLFVKYSA